MIECTNKNIFYKKKSRKKMFKRFFNFLIIISIILSLFLYYNKISSPFIMQICVDKVYQLNTKCINQSVLISLDNKIFYDDFVSVEKNSNGEIILISAKSQNINSVSRNVVEYASNAIESELDKGIKIPCLAFLFR